MSQFEKQLELFAKPQREVWSYSRLKALRRCALEYKVRYIDGGKWAFQPGYIDVQAGRLLHNIVRKYYTSTATPEPYRLLLAFYKRLAPKTLNWIEDLRGEVRTLKALRLFSDSGVSKFQPVATEVSCKTQIGNLDFSGKADLIYSSKEHPEASGILEFKLDDVEVCTEDPIESFLQCLIYHMGLPDKYRRGNGRVGVYIFDTGQLLETKIDDSIIEAAVRIIERDLRRAEGPNFPPTRNPFCSSCGYQSICPAYSNT